MTDAESLKRAFREGRQAEAIAACEALCRDRPADSALRKLCATMHSVVGQYARALELLRELRRARADDPDVLFNIGVCERESGDPEAAARTFSTYTAGFPKDPEGWVNLAECQLRLKRFADGLRSSDRALRLDPQSLPAWTNRADCQKALGRPQDALESHQRALRIAPSAEGWLAVARIRLELGRTAEALDDLANAIRLAPAAAGPRMLRGDTLQRLGRLQDAAADYAEASRLAPEDADALKKATLCLLQIGQGERALALCRELLAADPANLTARLGAEWVLSQIVPLWHVPMMNEHERNRAYREGLESVELTGRTVFEIGTGSGLLAMMAARQGARHVHTCEAVPLIATTARRIVERNGLAGRITVLSKPSTAVRLGEDLPAKADVLVHEIFSSELLGEHVLPAIEDARQRLLAPGGAILPSAASIMIALVGGEALGRYVHAGESCGFDLGEFNAIHPKKWPLSRVDLAPELLSDDVEAFRFDFAGASTFPAERKRLELVARRAGTCYGVIQWIRIELGERVRFENHPSQPRQVANWQPMIFGFDEPLRLDAGAVVPITAMHDRTRPWFDLAGVRGA